MSRLLNIEIETTEPLLGHGMFGTSEFSAGETQLTLPDGSIAVWSSAWGQKSFGAPEIIGITVTLLTGSGTSLVGSWLYEKLKGRPAKLRINRTEVEIEPNKIRIVIEQIEREE